MKLLHQQEGIAAQVDPTEKCKITLSMDAIFEHYKIKLKNIGVITSNEEFQDLAENFPPNFKLTSLVKSIRKVKDPCLLSQAARSDFDNDLVILAAHYRATTKQLVPILYIQMRNIACAVCGIMMEKPKYCTRCVYTPYCSKECQRQDWHAGHKMTCKDVPVFKKRT